MHACMEAAGERRSSSSKHIILVHGVCHGGWCWYKVAPRLQSAGHHVTALDLAASGVDGRRLREVPTFRDYTEPLLAVLRSLPAGEKAILVGHSLGGINLALAGELFPEKVAAAVFLTALIPDYTSPPSFVFEKLCEGNWAVPLDNEVKPQDADGKLPTSLLFGPQFIEEKLYQLCSLEDITLAKSLIRVGSVFLEDLQLQQPFSKERYGSVRKIYVVCKQDQTLPVEFQKWMVTNSPADEVKEIDGADHMAMLSTPDELVKCIVDIAERYA